MEMLMEYLMNCLDCDVIVREEILKLWNTDVAGYALAATEDVPIFDHVRRLDFKEDAIYFNAGVMVVNLEYWRKCDARLRFLDCLQQHRTKILFHDQDVLNIVFVEEKKKLPLRWNIMDVLFAQPRLIPSLYMQQAKTFMKNPAIIHFAGGLKPWDCKLNNPFQKDYFYFLDRTPWKGIRPTFKSVVRKRGPLKAFINRIGLEYYIKNLIK
jgi:lipopolysaccharide biosynthesis glycosyltransferase